MSPIIQKNNVVKPASIQLFTEFVLSANYDAAEKVLGILMNGGVKDIINRNLISKKMELNQKNFETEGFNCIERFAASLTIMFGDVRYDASVKMYNFYVHNKYFITYIFTASHYKNTDHIVKSLGLLNKKQYTKADIKRLLILFTTESTFELPWAQLVKFMPTEVVKAYLGMFSAMSLMMSKNSLAQLNKLASIAPSLPLVNFRDARELEIISSGYFSVSNLTGPDKNEFKKWAVKNYQKFMNDFLSPDTKALIQKDISQPNNNEKNKGKKTILIIHEHYFERHAMYRCYHSLIAGLNDEFHVVGLADASKVDELGKKDSADFFTYENIYDFDIIIKDIISLSPDIIIYPSIGMSNHVPLLATQRLAPIQCMCLGHPSSSYIPTIDYVHYCDIPGIEANVIQALMNEKITSTDYSMQGTPCEPYTIKKETVKNDNVVKIAVNGVTQKVTFELIEICQKITAASATNIEFQFFLGGRRQDVDYFATLSTLKRLLPNHYLHPFQSYDDYMNVLSQCSFAIPTIPFGGTNSNIDSLKVAIPKLYVKDERDFSGLTDYQMWDILGIIDGYCKSTEDLIERAASYINDDSEHYVNYKDKLKNYDLSLLEEPVKEKWDKSFANMFAELLTKENIERTT